MVKDMLHDAMDSSIIVCGMTPLDPDDPCYDFYIATLPWIARQTLRLICIHLKFSLRALNYVAIVLVNLNLR
jgi:hypothetical protein